MSKTLPLHPGRYYHVFNRGNNRENLFREERNYRFFLRRYAKYVTPVVDTFAYCLLPNHFHLLIRVKPPRSRKAKHVDANPSMQFRHLFSGYAKAINRAYGRTGSLFQRAFQRREVDTERYRSHLVLYIHQNPVQHGFVSDLRAYPHSSYPALVGRRPTRLRRSEVHSWFGGVDGFVQDHAEPMR